MMAVVGVAVAIPATLLVRDGGAEPERIGPVTLPSAVEEPLRTDRGLRVGYRVPRGWKRIREDRTLKLRSRNRTTLVAIAAPASADRAGRVRRDLLREIRRAYRGADIRAGGERRVGGLDARTAVIGARRPGGGRIRILLAVAPGTKRTYVVETFTAPGAESRRIVQAQEALNALELRG